MAVRLACSLCMALCHALLFACTPFLSEECLLQWFSRLQQIFQERLQLSFHSCRWSPVRTCALTLLFG